MQTQTSSSTAEIPSVAAVVTHEVADYAAWKQLFDADAPRRRAAGIIAAHINRHADNPNLLSVYLGARDAGKLGAFLHDDELKAVMAKAGVKGPPHIALVTPVEDLTVKDRRLAGVIVKHEVADYGAWKKAFDAHAATRAKAGIVGHAINRGVDNPNVVVAYMQAESPDALHAFAASADLKQTMQNAGVKGAPELIFAQGQDWES